MRSIKPPADPTASSDSSFGIAYGLLRADEDRIRANVPGLVRAEDVVRERIGLRRGPAVQDVLEVLSPDPDAVRLEQGAVRCGGDAQALECVLCLSRATALRRGVPDGLPLIGAHVADLGEGADVVALPVHVRRHRRDDPGPVPHRAPGRLPHGFTRGVMDALVPLGTRLLDLLRGGLVQVPQAAHHGATRGVDVHVAELAADLGHTYLHEGRRRAVCATRAGLISAGCFARVFALPSFTR